MPKGILNNSDEIRKLIIHQATKYNIPFRHIARDMWTAYEKLLENYINIKDIHTSENLLPDHKIMHMAKLVGLDIRIVTVIKNEEKFKEEVKEIKKRLKEQYARNDKKTHPAPEIE